MSQRFGHFYIEWVLAPELRAADVVVMDNLSAHEGSRMRQLIEEQGLRAHLPAALLAGL